MKNLGTRIITFEGSCASYGRARVLELLGKYDEALRVYEIIYEDRKTIANQLKPYRSPNGVNEVPDTSRTTASQGQCCTKAAQDGGSDAVDDAAAPYPAQR